MRGRQALRALLGLALAPLIAASVVAIFGPFFLDTRTSRVYSSPGSQPILTMTGLLEPALWTGAIVTLFAALPAHVVFHQRRWSRLRHYVVLGALLGASPFLIYLAFVVQAAVVNGPIRDLEILRRLAALGTLGTIAGTTAAAVFWWIAVRSAAPDRPGTLPN